MVSWFKYYIKLVNRLGFKKEPEEFNLFKTTTLDLEQAADKLRVGRYFYNDFSTTYHGQVYTVRKLVDLDHQIHLRIYRNGMVTGHYELRPEHASEHLKSIELRKLNHSEKEEVREILCPQ